MTLIASNEVSLTQTFTEYRLIITRRAATWHALFFWSARMPTEYEKMENTTRQLWRIGKVSEIVGAAKSTIYEWLRDEKDPEIGKVRYNFPKPIEVSPRFIAWYSDEVMDWLNALPRTS